MAEVEYDWNLDFIAYIVDKRVPEDKVEREKILDEHTGWDQRTLGPQLREDVDRHIVVATNMVEFQAFEVGLELSYLGVVGIHRDLLDVSRLVDLVDEDFGVAVGNEPLNSQGDNDAQSVDQGLVLGAIVGRLVVDL
jgi:hypothetical protein